MFKKVKREVYKIMLAAPVGPEAQVYTLSDIDAPIAYLLEDIGYLHDLCKNMKAMLQVAGIEGEPMVVLTEIEEVQVIPDVSEAKDEDKEKE